MYCADPQNSDHEQRQERTPAIGDQGVNFRSSRYCGRRVFLGTTPARDDAGVIQRGLHFIPDAFAETEAMLSDSEGT